MRDGTDPESDQLKRSRLGDLSGISDMGSAAKAEAEMDPNQIGRPTFHTRAERWECDFNEHWNTRFHVRSFQLATENIFAGPSGISPGAWRVPTRHMRFHREVLVSQAVSIRSARVTGGAQDGAIAHFLFREEDLAATAIDSVPLDSPSIDLPEVDGNKIPVALPRGLAADDPLDWPPFAFSDQTTMLGPVRPGEADHTGALTAEEVIRRSAVTSHGQLNRLGMTPAYATASRINRMVVEFRLTLGKVPAAGTLLFGESRILDVGTKTFRTAHRIVTQDGETVAQNQQLLVAVNLDSRRAVEVPQFLRDALATELQQRT